MDAGEEGQGDKEGDGGRARGGGRDRQEGGESETQSRREGRGGEKTVLYSAGPLQSALHSAVSYKVTYLCLEMKTVSRSYHAHFDSAVNTRDGQTS